jgi:outer membrane protein assembly factor BamD
MKVDIEYGIKQVLLILTISLFLLPAGCGGKKVYVARSAEEAFDYAMENYQKGEYDEAISGFQRVIFNYPGVGLIDQAMFYMADSYFKDEDYLLAANEFKRVSAEFPDGPFAEKALYKLGLCYMELSYPYQLDQKDTRRAILSFGILLDRFPESAYADSSKERTAELRDKLARKEFESGYYYYKRKYYDSAIICFETMTDEFQGSRWLAPTFYYLSKAYDKLELNDEAAEARNNLVEQFPESDEALKTIKDYPDNMQSVK